MLVRLLSPLVLLIGLVQSGGIGPAERAHSEAVRLLSENDAAGAEAAARRALSKSSYFEPEREIQKTPEKGVLFEDMIEKARTAYRERRARYFEALGNALVEQVRWAEGRKSLRRSVNLVPSAETLLGMASHPDLDVAQRIDLLLEAYFAPEADQADVERALMKIGAFADKDALRAVFDRERFALELEAEFPGIEVVLAPLPDIRIAATRSTFVSSEYLNEGMTVVLYFPVDACPRCSEELDAIGGALIEWRKQGHEFAVGAFVEERDLTSVRRIVRLLTMQIEVGRADRLPAGIAPADGGEIWIVSRRGLLQVRIPLDGAPGSRIREQVTAVLQLLGPPEEKEPGTTTRRTRRREKSFSTLVDEALALEAGPVPIPDRYKKIDLALREIVRDATNETQVLNALQELARLRGAGAAKSRAFLALDKALPGRLLAAVKEIAPEIDVQASPQQGVFYVGVTDVEGQKTILLQRTFFSRLLPQNFDFILRLEGGRPSVVWLGTEPHEPRGTQAISAGAVFFFEGEDCRGLRLIDLGSPLFKGGPVYEGCPARLEGEDIIEVKKVLLNDVPNGLAPLFYRRGKIEGSDLIAPESTLERGKRLFEEGSYRQALSAFQEASKRIDPVAPYDEIDIRYNIARCYEGLGQRPRALEIMESIGDAVYQSVVDEKIGELEVATRR